MIFKTELGDWTCLGESSLKYINEHFPVLIDDATLKMVYNKDPSVKVYPVYQEAADGYIIRLNPKKCGNAIGLLTADPDGDYDHFAYVAKTKKIDKPFDIKTLYEVLDEPQD
jgi:hypothetical protein